MVREFLYEGDRFRATTHGLAGKEEIFIVQMLDDDEEGAEISLDRFEDAGNDPSEAIERVLAKMVDRMRREQSLCSSKPGAAFAWSDRKPAARVHDGVQH
jgi:hypothetical protein